MKFRNESGQFASATADQAVVDKTDANANRKRLVRLRKQEARRRAEKRANEFLKSDNPLRQGLKALLDADKS